MRVSTFCKTLKDMGCTRQVMRRVAKQRSVESRARFMATVLYDAIMLMFLDESGHDQRNYLRKYGTWNASCGLSLSDKGCSLHCNPHTFT